MPIHTWGTCPSCHETSHERECDVLEDSRRRTSLVRSPLCGHERSPLLQRPQSSAVRLRGKPAARLALPWRVRAARRCPQSGCSRNWPPTTSAESRPSHRRQTLRPSTEVIRWKRHLRAGCTSALAVETSAHRRIRNRPRPISIQRSQPDRRHRRPPPTCVRRPPIQNRRLDLPRKPSVLRRAMTRELPCGVVVRESHR